MTDFFADLERELRRAHRRDTERSVLSRVFVRWRLSGLPVAALRPLVALAVVAALVAIVTVARESDVERPAAPPGQKVVTTDLDAGIRFSLDGRVLTVQLLPRTPSQTIRRVNGVRTGLTCGATGASPPSDSGATTLTQLWPAGQTSLSYRFRRDISKWCRLEDPVGRSVAFVVFPGAGALEEVNLAAGAWRSVIRSQELFSCRYKIVGKDQRTVERMSWTRCERRFPPATVQEIAIKGDRATVTYSNGDTVDLRRDANGAWHHVAPEHARDPG